MASCARPSSAAIAADELGDLLAVQLGHALARAREQREALRDAHGLGLLVLEVALREVADEADAGSGRAAWRRTARGRRPPSSAVAGRGSSGRPAPRRSRR